jgi:hypothetical protein
MSRIWNGNIANYLAPLANAHGDFPTVAAWVKLASYAANSGTTRPVAGQWDSGGKAEMLFVNFNGKVGYEVNIPPISSKAGATTLPLNEWHHVAGTYDGTIRVYLDGVLDGSLAVGGFTVDTSGGTWRIGYSSAGPWVWDGEIQDAALWSRPLTAKEIAALAGGVSPSRITNALLSHIPIWGEESPEPDFRRGAAANIVGTLPQGSSPLPPVASPFSAAG